MIKEKQTARDRVQVCYFNRGFRNISLPVRTLEIDR
jgi:hypothetical protein